MYKNREAQGHVCPRLKDNGSDHDMIQQLLSILSSPVNCGTCLHVCVLGVCVCSCFPFVCWDA